ncbi:hypothetical protein [Aquipseudomonas alcaligenes]|uniref:hypothetical protein n=1 Tax=Aquipseudomonas alcaligenes TaxID=43263 RepID=UPI000AFAF65A|nr:hypothetical protein [Pseudomonas alcaligenes]
MNISLSAEILSWKASTSSGTYSLQDGWDTPYKYFNLAENIIKTHSDPFQLIDAISNLKRSIDHRLKKISSDYSLKKLNHFGAPSDTLSKLEDLQIARPAMLTTIHSIRNQIEHGFREPPQLQRCLELTDLTWYFLKSTDSLSRLIPKSFSLNHEYISGHDSELWLEIHLSPLNDWEPPQINGWIEPWLLAAESNFSIFCDRLDGHLKKQENQKKQRLYFSGVCTAPKHITLDLIRAYFLADPHI